MPAKRWGEANSCPLSPAIDSSFSVDLIAGERAGVRGPHRHLSPLTPALSPQPNPPPKSSRPWGEGADSPVTKRGTYAPERLWPKAPLRTTVMQRTRQGSVAFSLHRGQRPGRYSALGSAGFSSAGFSSAGLSPSGFLSSSGLPSSGLAGIIFFSSSICFCCSSSFFF